MQDEIVKTGLLGTNRAGFQLAGDLNEIGAKVSASQEDKEDAFLKSVAIAFLYAESGLEAEDGDSALPVCPAETKSELNTQISQYMEDALAAKDEVLFDFLVTMTDQAEKLVSAKLVPQMLNKALEQKQKAPKIIAICGELGKWLCSLNPAWKKLNGVPKEEGDWETGSLEQRKFFLKQLREENPAEALNLLKNGFAQENAANRAEFVEVIQTGLSLNDEPFLQEVLSDKSKKVKEVALSLLQSLEGSVINNQYFDHLTSAFHIKEERQLLVLKKKVLHFDPSLLPSEEIFKTGIEKVSSEKGVEDIVFQAAQMLAFLNPKMLAKRFDLGEEDWIRLLLEEQHSAVFKPFLVAAAIRFRDELLAEKLLDTGTDFDIRLLEIVPTENRQRWFEKYLDSHFMPLLEMLLIRNYTILPFQLAERIIKRLVANPYQITQPYYQRIALAMPAQVIPLLTSYAEDSPDDYQRRYFSNQASGMLRYIELRERLIF